jgi:hypothetical protein
VAGSGTESLKLGAEKLLFGNSVAAASGLPSPWASVAIVLHGPTGTASHRVKQFSGYMVTAGFSDENTDTGGIGEAR